MGKWWVLTALLYLTVCCGEVTAGKHPSCNLADFDSYVNNYCILQFTRVMDNLNYTVECPWPTSKIPYSILMACVDAIANGTFCIDPSLKNQLFLKLHQQFFFLCPSSQLANPSLHIVLLLVLPCVLSSFLLPFLCILITVRTANKPLFFSGL